MIDVCQIRGQFCQQLRYNLTLNININKYKNKYLFVEHKAFNDTPSLIAKRVAIINY